MRVRKRHLKTLTPERQVSESGYRYYDPEKGRWPNRDPIWEKGFLVTRSPLGDLGRQADRAHRRPRGLAYAFAENNAIGKYDVLGLLAELALDVWYGAPIRQSFGFTGGASIVGAIPGLPEWVENAIVGSNPIGIIAGAQTAVIFFPDACEVGIFQVTAGLGETLALFEPLSADELGEGEWFEGGLMASLGGGIEYAEYTGGSGAGGLADAASFKGVFHTASVGVGPAGLSMYIGEDNPSDPGGSWEGGTFTLGLGGGANAVSWRYEPVDTWEIQSKCFCALLAGLMPVGSATQ